MMRHDLVRTACAELQHCWELRGHLDDPTTLIRRIASSVTPVNSLVLEDALYERWAQLQTTTDNE